MIRRAVCCALIFVAVSAFAQKKRRSTFDVRVRGVVVTCDSSHRSPPLGWSGEPQGTRSFALVMVDRDAHGIVHWLLWDIPASAHSLPAGAKTVGTSGVNSDAYVGYDSPCPGVGSHVYSFTLYALDVPTVNLVAGKGLGDLQQAMQNHVLAKAEDEETYGN